MELKFCEKCVLPNTRPFLIFDSQNVCSACRQAEHEVQVDWVAREQEWRQIVEQTKQKGRRYDCLLPVSGGKDSFWQTLTCLHYGLHPLAFTWRPPCRTLLGEENLAMLRELGVDHLDFSVNPRVERIITRRTFEETGADSAMHLAVFTSVIRHAYQLDIPLVVWSENSATTYAGVGNPLQGSDLTIEWVKTLGSTHGKMAEDWAGEGVTTADLAAYWCPTQQQLEWGGIRQVFLGYYLDWDGERNYDVAKAKGFQQAEKPLTGWFPWADLDDPFVVAHHFLKLHKFGFSRVQDNLSQEIRHGRMRRQDAVDIIGSRPTLLRGDRESLEMLCAYVERPLSWLREIVEKFRNPSIWEKRPDGVWHIPNFLVPGFRWEAVCL